MILDLHDIISTADKSMEVSVLPEKEFFVSAAGSFPISSKKPCVCSMMITRDCG